MTNTGPNDRDFDLGAVLENIPPLEAEPQPIQAPIEVLPPLPGQMLVKADARDVVHLQNAEGLAQALRKRAKDGADGESGEDSFPVLEKRIEALEKFVTASKSLDQALDALKDLTSLQKMESDGRFRNIERMVLESQPAMEIVTEFLAMLPPRALDRRGG